MNLPAISKTRTFILLFVSLFIATNIFAQTPADIKAQMVTDWQRAKSYTDDYLNTMPADKYSFKAVDSIRSFAQQMLHLAQGTVFLISNATGGTQIFTEDLEHSATAQNKDSVVYYVNAAYDYAIKSVQDFDVSKFMDKIKVFGMETTRYAMFLKAFEHQTHHRGQTTIYIRLVGIRPPQERLF